MVEQGTELTHDNNTTVSSSRIVDAANDLQSIRRNLWYLSILLSGVVFYFGKDIVMPVALGLLITLTLTPVVRLLQKLRVPAPIAALLVVVSISAVLAIGVMTLSAPVSEMFQSLPKIGERIERYVQPYKSTISDISRAGDKVEELTVGEESDDITRVVVQGPGFITSAASTLATGLTSLFIALLLSLFMLGSGTLFYEKIVSSVPLLSNKKRALSIVRDVESSVSHYLFTISIINVSLGVVVGLLLYLYGVPSAALWGVIAATLNFLPFIGAIVGAVLLAAVSIGVYDTLLTALVPPLIYYGCSAIEGNLVTPFIVGRRLRLNIVAVFLSVAFWGWLWGLAGALMAVPLLVFTSVLCEHVEGLRTLGHFLTSRDESGKHTND